MKRFIAFGFIIFVYIVAFAAGAGSYIYFTNKVSPLLNMLIADIVATVIVWIFGLIIKNSSVYDPYWSLIPFVIMVIWLIEKGTLNTSDYIILFTLGYWSWRLTFNWAVGFTDIKHEDWRYVNYRKNKPLIWHFINFFGIMLMPTLLVYGGMIPVWYGIMNDANIVFAIIGGIITFIAAILQTISDIQMKRYRKINKNKTITSGLWKYSRHPNYFGEILVWWGMFIVSITVAPFYVITGAISITLLFIFISIPLMEKRLSFKTGWDEYKRITSPLIPLPQKQKI